VHGHLYSGGLPSRQLGPWLQVNGMSVVGRTATPYAVRRFASWPARASVAGADAGSTSGRGISGASPGFRSTPPGRSAGRGGYPTPHGGTQGGGSREGHAAGLAYITSSIRLTALNAAVCTEQLVRDVTRHQASQRGRRHEVLPRTEEFQQSGGWPSGNTQEGAVYRAYGRPDDHVRTNVPFGERTQHPDPDGADARSPDRTNTTRGCERVAGLIPRLRHPEVHPYRAAVARAMIGAARLLLSRHVRAHRANPAATSWSVPTS
jgi:hypothetical protein